MWDSTRPPVDDELPDFIRIVVALSGGDLLIAA
jgi:hypothetical protein